MSNHLKRNLEYYDGGFETEEYLSRKYHRVRCEAASRIVANELAKLTINDVRLLDIGCSSGYSTELVFGAHLKLMRTFGLDVSISALTRAIERGVLGVGADIETSLPFASNCFDVVFAGEIIEHIIEIDSFLVDVRRCLKPRGLLVLTTPNLARLVDRIRFIAGLPPKQTVPMHRYLKYHVTPFTYASLRASLERCGYHIERFASNFVYFDPTCRTKFKSRLAARIAPSLGGTLIVGARKRD